MNFGNLLYEPNPCGSHHGKNNFHNPFKATAADFMNKRHQNYFRNTDGIPEEYDRMKKIHHTSISNEQNNLMNFNPTSKGLTYFEEHETNKHLHYQLSKPRFENVIMKDTSIVDKIDDYQKDGHHYHKYPSHSHSLKARRL